MNAEPKALPLPTLRRLPRYVYLLKKLERTNVRFVSATLIAEALGLESIQVRKDLAMTGIIGKPKTGYQLNELINSIVHFLNWDNMQDAFLVGAGGLGRAILGYKNFQNYGLNILAAFDSNPKKIGRKIHGIEIFPIEKMKDLAKRMNIRIGVITVTPEYAQTIADDMIAGGIRAIWNFAPVSIKVPDDVALEHVHLSQSLGVLTHKLSVMLNSEINQTEIENV